MSDLDTTATRAWTIEAVQQLVGLAREGVPVPVISLKLKRSITAVREKLAEIGVRRLRSSERPRWRAGWCGLSD